MMGDVIHHRLDNATLIVQGGSWLASDPDIAIDASFQGLGKAFFSGEGAFWVKCSGSGICSSILLDRFMQWKWMVITSWTLVILLLLKTP